jgi:ribA/ribD-fused uncharacterized protein
MIYLRENFAGVVDEKMGSQLNCQEKETLCDLFEQAVYTGDIYGSLKKLVGERVNQPNGWSATTAAKIHEKVLMIIAPETLAKKEIERITETGLVCFYKTGPTKFLGNFAECPQGIEIEGKKFKCSEAAFQWFKYYYAAYELGRADLYNDPKMQNFFTCNGEEAFQINQDLKTRYPNVLHSQWDHGLRDQAMWNVLNAKFQQNPEFQERLQMTKGAYLLEHSKTKRDNYWSDNNDGTGQNMLGKMLMALRDGKPCPTPCHGIDPEVKAHAENANRPYTLDYAIF